VTFFFAGIVLSYTDRTVLGVVLPQVRKDLALTNTQYSLTIDAFLIMSMIRVWQGATHRIAPLAELSDWFNKHIDPRK